jgi:predicted benzoate:H+ symporter BenE
VPAILAMPPEIIAVVAGLALIPPLIGALVSAFDVPATRFAAAATFAVTASGVARLWHRCRVLGSACGICWSISWII